MKMKKLLPLIGSVLGCQLVGFFGAIFTASNVETWYAGLAKPVLNPPNWLFGPVWVLLYTFMGISAFLIWNVAKREKEKKAALRMFFVQLALNALWSMIFFGMHLPAVALVEIVLLLFAIVITIRKFYPLSKPAAVLLMPYAAWVAFATYLNYAILMLN